MTLQTVPQNHWLFYLIFYPSWNKKIWKHFHINFQNFTHGSIVLFWVLSMGVSRRNMYPTLFLRISMNIPGSWWIPTRNPGKSSSKKVDVGLFFILVYLSPSLRNTHKEASYRFFTTKSPDPEIRILYFFFLSSRPFKLFINFSFTDLNPYYTATILIFFLLT